MRYGVTTARRGWWKSRACSIPFPQDNFAPAYALYHNDRVIRTSPVQGNAMLAARSAAIHLLLKARLRARFSISGAYNVKSNYDPELVFARRDYL